MTVWRFLHDSRGSLPLCRAAWDVEIIVLLSEQWFKKLLTLVEKNIALKGTDVLKKKVGLRKGETLFERIIAIRGCFTWKIFEPLKVRQKGPFILQDEETRPDSA